MAIKNLSLNFNRFKSKKGTWICVCTECWFDTWKNETTNERIKVERSKLFEWIDKGNIKPL